jgi:hypothetical protein
MITGKAAVLNGAQITKAQVKTWIESVRLQLETNTFDPATLPAIIDPRAMMVMKIKIATSRTLRENPSNDWQNEWDMETFLKALEEVFAESDSDRFETATALWKNGSYDLRYNLEVDQGDMDNFSRILTRAIVDKHHLTPMPESEVKSICWRMVPALKARENKWGNSNPNLKFHQEFEAALKNDQEFEHLPTVERFLFICEELVHK